MFFNFVLDVLNTSKIFLNFKFCFRTYADCEFKPGPHLNELLGPNGMFQHPAVL